MALLFSIKSYCRFLWKSKNEHGVHSPFVFDLVTKCFYDRDAKPEYEILRNYRLELLQNKNSIDITDFGTGSKVFKSNSRPISKIAQTAGISEFRAELLFRITRYFQPNSVLEIGTSLGLATAALSLGNPKAKITTLEGCPETARIAKHQFHKFQLHNIQSEVAEFNTFLQNDQLSITNYQLIYFDGNHAKEATLRYFELLLPSVANESVWIFDDIYWSPHMNEAWELIKAHPKVKVTIDTFQWGMVFFRNEQEKEHFTIRI